MERVCGALPSAGVSAAVWSAPALLLAGQRGASSGLFAVCGGRLGAGGAGSLDWMERTRSGAEVELGDGEHALPFISLGANQKFSQQSFVAGRPADPQRLAAALRVRAGVAGDVRRAGTVSGNLLSGANWIRLGVTRGEGRMGRHSAYRSVPRAIYVYPLVTDFRSFLQGRSDESAQPSGAAERRAEA